MAYLLYAIAPLFWLPQAALLALAVDRLQNGAGLTAMVMPAAGIVLLGVLRATCEACSTEYLYRYARDYLSQWRGRVIATLSARSPLDRERIPAGAAASVLAEQAEAILPWLTRYQSAVWRVRVVPLLLLVPVAWFSWAAAVVLLLAAPLIPLFMALVGWRAKAVSEEQWLQLGNMHAFLLDRLRGLSTLRALAAIDLTARRLRHHAEDLRQRAMRVLRIAFLSSAVLELFAALGVAFVAVYVGFHLLGYLNVGSWGQRLTLAQGLFVLLLAPAFFEPLRELAAVWHDRATGEAAMDALRRLEEGGLPLPDAALFSALPDAASATAHARSAPGVMVQGLNFAFHDNAAVFKNFHLNIKPGEHVALVGGSGAGKTVLLSLLAGLVAATSAEITIGGVRMTPRSLPLLRSRMGWMGQRPHVFAGSVQYNVALGRNGIGDSEVLQAIHLAGLAGGTRGHPELSLGEGGAGLSGGENARLALARLAVAAPQVDLLLVDEPTAHLDRETAKFVTKSLLTLATKRTLIVATHDPLLAASMDRIIQIPSLRTAPTGDK